MAPTTRPTGGTRTPGTSRLATPKPPRRLEEKAEPHAAGEFVRCTVLYTVPQRYPKSFMRPESVEPRLLCRYRFWFERGRCVQAEVSTAERIPDGPGFSPAIGIRGPDGDRTFSLPLIEKDLGLLFGAVQSSRVTG